jgi:predicted RNA-binding Zn-ribbon protein involved in translation (DUF1610 family)
MEERDHTTDVAPAGTELPRVGPADFQFTRERHTDRRRDEGLHICPACDSGLVHPVDWSPAAGRRWLVDLRCPECGWTGGGTYSQKVVDRFDEVLDDGTEALLDDLNRLSRANMEEHVEAFVAALEADRILPEDF